MSRREFRCREGGTNKFWAVTLEDRSLTVEFGRIGTAGQGQTKDFADAAAARAAADKLIAEKTRKGYVEVGGAAAPAAAAPKAKAAPAKAKPAAAAPPAPTPLPAAPVVTHTIDLDPTDWYLAPWRRLAPLPRPAARPARREPTTAKALLKEMNGWGYFGTKGGEPVAAELRRAPQADVLAALVDSDVFPLHFLVPTGYDPMDHFWMLGEVLPHLEPAEADVLRAALRKRLPKLTWPTSQLQAAAPAYYLAALLGLHDEMLALVRSWPDDLFAGKDWDHTHHQAPQWLVFGLGSAELVTAHMRRLGLHLRNPWFARAWLAHTEFVQLDYLRDNILAETNREVAEKVAEVLCLVKAPEAAGPILDVRLNSKAVRPSRMWLEEQTGNAVAGLLPVAAGRGRPAEAAVDFLRAAKKQGHGPFIEEQARQAPAEVAERVRTLVLEHVEKDYEPLTDTPAWLTAALATTLTPKGGVLGWARPDQLPPILVGDRRLPDTTVAAVLDALRTSPLGQPAPLLKALKEHADRASLDAFAWKLFDSWYAEGAPTKEKWAMMALGHLGGDVSAVKLAPMVKAWPGENQHPRAVLGLEVFRAMGSDGALMILNGIAQKLKFKGLQNKAREMMEGIAADRGLTREQLEDRIVPDLGLDARGRREFDFGPRRFSLALGADLKPVVRDDTGKLRDDLPKPTAKDDAAKAAAAVEDWKLLKKQLRDALKVQAFRLEQAMITGRRWTPAEHETLLVRHPLMIHPVGRLLWGGYDAAGKLLRTFRVTQEQEHADADDRPVTTADLAAVGIVHPLELTEEQRTRWGEVFGDYEVIPPFAQLARDIYRVDPKEAKETAVTRFARIKVPGAAIASYLEGNGWQRGPAEDHGDFSGYYKYFPAADTTAVVEVEPCLWVSNIGDLEERGLPNCGFLRGLVKTVWGHLRYTPKHKPLPLGKVDPVVYSEVMADLNAVAAKGK